MNNELLKKYRTNSCSAEELHQVLQWFEKIAGTTEGREFLQNELWEGLPDEDARTEVNFDHALDKIHHQINLARTEQRTTDRNLRISNRGGTRFRRFLTRAAAIMILPILGYGIYMSFKYQSEKERWIAGNQAHHRVSSSVNSIAQVTLPDGTHAWLNRNSSLSYPASFNGEVRRVELEGEGYFEVAHHPEVPFVVQVGEIGVKATGTAFNVMAYSGEENIEVSLLDGSVEVHQLETDGNATLLLQMEPGDFLRFDRINKQYITRTFFDDRYFAWKDGKLVFENAPMSEMVRRLSRWYNVEIQIESPELLELTYTATFINETLPQVMELLSNVSPIQYSISDRKKTADGTFSKQTVHIRKK